MQTQNIFSLSLAPTQESYNYSDFYSETDYEYVDAMGNPYINTNIPSRLSAICETIEEDEPILDLSHDQLTMLVSLSNSNDRCPMRCMNDGASWGSAVNAYNEELADIKKADDLADFTEFNKKSDEDIIKHKSDILLASLPKFPKAMIERMKKEAEEIAMKRPNASKKFYTWKKGVTSSATSRTAWGHRRSGGGKGKVQTLSEMNSEKAISELATKKRIRQQANKEKAEVESFRIAEKMKTLEIQKIALTPIIEEQAQEPVEETDFQRFRREEMESFNTKSAPIIDYVVAKPKAKTDEKWTKVDVKQTKNEKIAMGIMRSLCMKPTNNRTGAMNKLAGMKKGGGEMRSRLCKSVMPGGNRKCPHGSACKFAHAPSQLNIKGCVFGERCNFVTKDGDGWKNTKSKVCQFGHPGEENDKPSFCKRIGMICLEVTPPIVICAKSKSVEKKASYRTNISYSTVVKPVVVVKPEPDCVRPIVVKPEPIVVRPETAYVRPNISYSAVVVTPPRIFKIHKDQIGRTMRYILSMKLTNVQIEFI